MPVFPTHQFNTGNPNLDNQLRKLARAVKSGHPAGSGRMRISVTPTGTIYRESPSRRRYPVTSGGGGAGFSGNVYVKGVLTILTGTALAWVRINLQTGSVTYNAGPAPSPFPPFEEWRYVPNCSGDIYV